MVALHYTLGLKVLTEPNVDTDLSLWLSCDFERYLFGCGEGTQRALVQKRQAIKGLKGIFINDGRSSRAGLPGLIMTAADAGIQDLDIMGPPDIGHFLATSRGSLGRSINVKVLPHKAPSGEIHSLHQTPYLTVRSIAFTPDNLPGPSRPPLARNDSGRVRAILDDMFINRVGPQTQPRMALPMPAPDLTATDMVYICQAADIQGKFDAAKAKELKIPNHLRGPLTRGQSVTYEDPDNPGQQRTVQPDEICSATRQGPVIIMVNCSSPNLSQLLASPSFDEFFNGTKAASTVVHRVPTSVWQDKSYQSWMQRFGDSTQHLIADTDAISTDSVFAASAYNTLYLNAIDDKIFPLPHNLAAPKSDGPLLPNMSFLQPGQEMKLQPPGPLHLASRHEKDIPFPSSSEDLARSRRERAAVDTEFFAAVDQARASVRADARWDAALTEVSDNITVTTLGTGSAIPSKYRNVSSTHLDIPDFGGILLDAGEGTLGQLRRKFGMAGMQDFYNNLKIVHISHMHADHHLGLQSILHDRFKHGLVSPLYLVAPMPITLSLSESGSWLYGVSQEAVDNVIWLSNEALATGRLPGMAMPPPPEAAYDASASFFADAIPSPPSVPRVSPSFTNGTRRWPKTDLMVDRSLSDAHIAKHQEILERELGIVGLRTPRVSHRGPAFGFIIEHRSGWKIAYSGDTRPCQSLVEAGQGATLLIHEATLDDQSGELAATKGHSTFSEAIDIGIQMKAKHILLNHFSQRYPKIQKNKQRADEAGGPVISVSFDFMSCKIGHMWRMKHYMDALELLNKEDEDDAEVQEAVVEDRNVPKKGKAGKKQDKKATQAKREASPSLPESTAKKTKAEVAA